MVGDCSALVGWRADESIVTESVPSDIERFEGAASNGVDGVASKDGGSRALADVRSCCWAQTAVASVAATKYEHTKEKNGSNAQMPLHLCCLALMIPVMVTAASGNMADRGRLREGSISRC